jgi:signal transduction histidine kinase
MRKLGDGGTHISLPFVLRGALFLFLVLSSIAMLHTTARNTRSARTFADQSLESAALAISRTAEAVLTAGGYGRDGEIREILSDRVVAYALIAGRDGKILFHTNPGLVGSRLAGEALAPWPQGGKSHGRRVRLGTGLPAYEYSYAIRREDGPDELLRLVLHSARADRIVSDAQGMWWTAGFTLSLLWTVGILLERVFSRQLRLRAEADRRERLALIGQMTASLAHEIRNALGSMKGYAQWVDEKVAPSDSRKPGIAGILKGTDRIEALVNDLLLFSREETYRIEPVDTAALIRDAVAGEAMREGGTIDLETPQGIRAMADPEKLRRVLANGIRNAAQAMEGGGRLRISARREGRFTSIRIEDEGKGIPDQELPRLFTPFHTTKIDGTGLGLAYSRKAIEGLGGRIELANRKDAAGAVLTIRLPAAGE